jgi:hypothetical protein
MTCRFSLPTILFQSKIIGVHIIKTGSCVVWAVRCILRLFSCSLSCCKSVIEELHRSCDYIILHWIYQSDKWPYRYWYLPHPCCVCCVCLDLTQWVTSQKSFHEDFLFNLVWYVLVQWNVKILNLHLSGYSWAVITQDQSVFGSCSRSCSEIMFQKVGCACGKKKHAWCQYSSHVSSVTAMNSQLICWHHTTRLSSLTLEEGPKILLVGKIRTTVQIAKGEYMECTLHLSTGHQSLKIHKLDTSVSLGLPHQSAFGEKCDWILWNLLAIHFSAIKFILVGWNGVCKKYSKSKTIKEHSYCSFHCTNVLLLYNLQKIDQISGHVYLCSIQQKPTGTGSNDATNYSNFTNWMD